MIDVDVIAGPTASGKSALALDWATRIGGEIINADAMQVYAPLRVLTARPDAAALAAVPHHLDGVADGHYSWSAGTFATAAAAAIACIADAGRRPVIVGGTGLWLRALIDGLSPIPDVPADVVAAAEAHLAEIGLPRFREALLARDPALARLSPQDPQRHVRAEAVWRATGRPLSYFQSLPPAPLLPLRVRALVLKPTRARNHQWAEQRLDHMLAAGAQGEVRGLLDAGLPDTSPVWNALGARTIAAHLAGTQSLAEAREATLIATRQLIKRQSTWFRNQCPHWPEAADAEAALRLLDPSAR